MIDSTGHIRCSRCGRDLGNGALDKCAVLSVLGDDGIVANHHFCVSKPDPCVSRVFTTKALAAYHEEHSDAPGFALKQDVPPTGVALADPPPPKSKPAHGLVGPEAAPAAS